MKKLHENQKRLLDLLKSNIDEPLTMLELMEELGVASTSVVHHHILQLEKKGFLKRNPSNPRDYQLLNEPEKSIVYINLYGLAQCGVNGEILVGNPQDRIPIASQILKFPTSKAFMVKAKGDSMSPKIEEGDLIIAEQVPTATNGDTIVCVNNGETLVKVFQQNDKSIILKSINSSKYDPFLASEDFLIVGVVRNVLNYS
jgi:repressor LexA